MWCAAILLPVAVWILLSGLDDLFVDLVWFFRRRQPFPWPGEAELAAEPQRRIAILVALWQEDAVIEQMLRHNLSVIRYANYDFFVGVYPNDARTERAVRRVARADSRVHIGVCPHPGPTSKGDCLNWAHKHLLEYEARHGVHFDILITHDAEDLVAPESLLLINWFSRDYQMVQIPVLPLATGIAEWTHGVYCDEFAEFQSKDIPVRQMLGGFLPSNGVGTGFDRGALESLPRKSGELFDPDCLTEDYENGFRMHQAGYRQIFVPLRAPPVEPVATREYFPRALRAAIRQRSRWVAGIILQGWQHHGWRVPARQWYWLWRDRKGLVGNLASPFANLVALSWLCAFFAHGGAGPWDAAAHRSAWLKELCLASAWISALQTGVRVRLCAGVYGWRFAAVSPLRVFWANLINCAATVRAIGQFTMARLRRRRLAWQKTEHVYPGGLVPARSQSRPRLGEVLIHLRFISTGDLEDALRNKAPGQRIGDYLLEKKRITRRRLHRALNSQSRVSAAKASRSRSPKPTRSTKPAAPAY